MISLMICFITMIIPMICFITIIILMICFIMMINHDDHSDTNCANDDTTTLSPSPRPDFLKRTTVILLSPPSSALAVKCTTT